MAKEMLINVVEGEECRIAIVDKGNLEEFYIERPSSEGHAGNIYKGRVVNIEPSIQAAFIDFGRPKNGFLHVSDIVPIYYPSRKRTKDDKSTEAEKKPSRRSRSGDGDRRREPIQKILHVGQEITVQVSKEGIGTKGPSLTTYVSLPGRYLVLMPHVKRLGVSRKIGDHASRTRLREMLASLDPPKDMGFIVRTAGMQHSKRDLQRDLRYLLRLWKVIRSRAKAAKTPAELYRESDLVVRALRDTFAADIEQIIIDSDLVFRRVRDFLKIAMPRYVQRAHLYDDKVPLFHKHKIEPQIKGIYARSVPLQSGGTIVIEQTEALVAVDVNSGSSRRGKDPEKAAHSLNVEAAREVARQLRLRDLGGVIIIDFVDMTQEKHQREVEQTLKESLSKDRARQRVGRMSRFGIIEMTRQRVRPSIQMTTFVNCPNCKGTGVVKPPETVALDVLRQINVAANHDDVKSIEVTIHPKVEAYLHNRQRAKLVEIEKNFAKTILILADGSLSSDEIRSRCLDARGNQVHS